MADENKGSWEKVGVAWEKVTKDNHGKEINWWIKATIDKPLFRGDQIALFKQRKDEWEKQLKREVTDKDPDLIIVRNRKWSNKYEQKD